MIHIQTASCMYCIDKAFCLRYIALEGVRIRCWDSSHEVQAAANRKQHCNEQYPNDTEALHEPPDSQTLAKIRQLGRPKQQENKLLSDHLMILLMTTIISNQKRNWNQSLKSYKLISSLQHLKCLMIMVHGMMVQYVGLSTVKQKVHGNTRFLFSDEGKLSSRLIIQR